MRAYIPFKQLYYDILPAGLLYLVILFSFYSCGLKLFLILSAAVIAFSDYKEKIGFTGQLLIEPKPKEPTKHQYDYGKCGAI